MRASLQTCTSPSGKVVIVGPPGTGKTDTILKIGHGQATIGRRVMYTAFVSSDVHTLVDKFLKNNATLPVGRRYADHEWVYVTGGCTQIDKVEKLRTEQTQGETGSLEANGKLFSYLRDGTQRSDVPRYAQTLGYKLSQRIKVWASDNKFNEAPYDLLHSRAKSFIETKAQLPFLQGGEKTHAKTHVQALEYNLWLVFLSQLKFCFCTLLTSGYELLMGSGMWDVLIIDEAARDTRDGIAVALGSLVERVKLTVWAGDYHERKGIIMGADSNVGHGILLHNVFSTRATLHGWDEAKPCEVFLLNICYRMQQSLIKWLSRWCYGGKIKSDDSTGTSEMSLRNTIRAYWQKRLPENFHGQYMQIGLDVTNTSIQDELMAGTTTRFNRGEARMIAMTVIDMIAMDPPTATKEFRRIRGDDICIIANFTGQVSEIQRTMRQCVADAKIRVKQEDLDAIWYTTTANVHGKERNITFYSTTIAPGVLRLPTSEHLAIGFVADINHFNVSVTRCRVARYTVGAPQLFVQAKKDSHPISRDRRCRGFFDFIADLYSKRTIVAHDDSERWFRTGTKPDTDDGFNRRLAQVASFTQTPEQKKAPPSGSHQ